MNWVEFLEANQIDYATRGPNTKRGEVSVRCPWCGEDDHSTHMGISLTAEKWGCLRNPAHRGFKAERLIAAILGCSFHQAKLVVSQYSVADPEGFNLSFDEKPTSGQFQVTETPPDSRSIQPTGLMAKFWRYLENRGFDDVASLVKQYDLSCCLSGRFKDSIVIPIYEEGALTAWTARAIIDPVNAPRYLSSNLIKTIVFNGEATGERLFITEGPFDALKLDFYGQHYGARAICTFGTSLSADQIIKLKQITPTFKKVTLLFDADAVEPMFAASDWLRNVTVGRLPEGVKDPGSMNKKQIEFFVKNGG